MSAQSTSATGALVLPAQVAPIGGADRCGFALIEPTDITDGTQNPVCEWVDVLRQLIRRNTASPGGSSNNAANIGKRGSDGTADGTANAILNDGDGFFPVGEKVGIGWSYQQSNGTLTAMAMSESLGIVMGTDATAWSPESTAEVLTFGDIAGSFQCLRGLWHLFAIRSHVMSTAEFQAIFNSKRHHEFVVKSDGNFTGPAGIVCMGFHGLHPANTIDGTTGTANFMWYNSSDDGVLYSSDKYNSGINAVETLTAATGFTTRSTQTDEWFEVMTVGSSVTSTPIGIQSNTLHQVVNRNYSSVVRLLIPGNSRAVTGNGRSFAMGIAHEPATKPNVIGVDNISMATLGVTDNLFFTGTFFTDNNSGATPVGVLHQQTDGIEELGREFWNSTAGINPTGTGTVLRENGSLGAAIEIKATHASGTGFSANTQAICVRPFALGWPGGGRIQLSTVASAVQNTAGTEVDDLGVIDCSTTIRLAVPWDANWTYNAGAKTITVTADLATDFGIVAKDGIVFVDDPYTTVTSYAKIKSVVWNGSTTTLTLYRALKNAPQTNDQFRIGPMTKIPLPGTFDGSEGANFRGVRCEAVPTYGPVVIGSGGVERTDVSAGLVVIPAGNEGAGYTVQLTAFADNERIDLLEHLEINAAVIPPAQQSSVPSSMLAIATLIQNSCSIGNNIAWVCDPQHGNWVAESHETWWAYGADNAAANGFAFANGCNDTRVPHFLVQLSWQFRNSDTAHLLLAGNIAWATAWMDDLATVMTASSFNAAMIGATSVVQTR